MSDKKVETQTTTIDSEEKFRKSIDKFVNGSFNFSTGFPNIPQKDVDPAWDRDLNELLFGISGVSFFFGSLTYKCQFHWSYALPTAGAYVNEEKLHITMNPWFMFEFLEKKAQRSFVIMHEVTHLMYEHSHRCRERNYEHSLWNQATDYYINLGLYDMQKDLPEGKAHYMEVIPQDKFPLCLNEEFRGMTEDQIYDILEKKQKGEGEGDNSEEGDGEGSEGSGQGSGTDQKSLEGYSQPTEQGGSGDAAERNRQAVAEAVRAASASAKASGYEPGNVEAGFIRSVLAATEQKVPWKDELAEYIIQSSDELLTYNKINRRNTPQIIFPSRTGDSINLFFGVDTSGSMGNDDLADASAGIQQICELFSSHKVFVASCDTTAYQIGAIDTETCDDFDPAQVDFRGGGGTIMAPMVEMAQDMVETGDREIDVMIIFTDGYLMDGDIDNVYKGDIPLIILVTEDGRIPSVESATKIIQLN